MITEKAKEVTAKEGYEVGYHGKMDNKNPYIPGELHDVWQANYIKGVRQRELEESQSNNDFIKYGFEGMGYNHT